MGTVTVAVVVKSAPNWILRGRLVSCKVTVVPGEWAEFIISGRSLLRVGGT